MGASAVSWPRRSSAKTAAPRSDASGTPETWIGRASESAMIWIQSRSWSSAAPVATTSLTCPIVTAEDHWAEGGLGEAVLSALADSDERPPVVRLAVHEMPHSGKPAELLAEAGIDADGIAAAARALVRDQVSAS